MMLCDQRRTDRKEATERTRKAGDIEQVAESQYGRLLQVNGLKFDRVEIFLAADEGITSVNFTDHLRKLSRIWKNG